MRSFKMNNGIFTGLEEPLKKKVEIMSPYHKICVILVDKMEIRPQTAYDKNEKQFFGNITIEKENLGNHILIALIRGVTQNWKECIAFEVTGNSTEPFLDKCIEFAEKCGLYVIAVSSDMGNSNRAVWSFLGIEASKGGTVCNSFYINGHLAYAIADIGTAFT